MADASGGSRGSALARALRAAEDVVAVVSVAFGPAGRGVLIRGPTGGLSITRAAMDILEAAFPPSGAGPGRGPGRGPGPEHVVLLQCARSLRQQTGDGVKCFLLTTLALLRGLQDGLQDGVTASTRLEMGRASAALSATLLPCVDSVLDPRRQILDASRVAESVLATRFTADVVSAVMPAVESLLRGADAVHLRKHLDLLCRRRHAAGRGVAESTVKDGVVVDGMLRFAGEGTSRRRLVVVAGGEGDDAVDVQAAVGALVRDSARLDDALVVTAAVLSDASLFALRRRGAAVLHAVTLDDERFVLDWTLASAPGVEVDVCADTRGAAWLGLAGVRHLQLHAPTQQLAEQLAAAVRDAVQLSCFAGGVSVVGGDVLCPGGGWLERELHRALGGTPLGRAELLQWHQHQHRRDRHPVVASLLAAFQGLSADTKKAVAEAVAAVPRALPPNFHLDPPLEPVSLRVAVLQHALASVGTLLSVDRVLTAKRV